MRRTALVAGGAGFIGGCVTRALLDNGWQIVVIDNLSNGNAEMVPPSARFIECNKGQHDTMAEVFREYAIDIVFDFAAHINVSEGERYPAEYFENNLVNTISLANVAACAGVKKYIFSSTAAVYGTPTTALVSETHPLRPASVYGKTKAMAEAALMEILGAAGCALGILRYFNVAGSFGGGIFGQYRPGQTDIMSRALDAFRGHDPVFTIHGTDWDTADGTGVRDYIHVGDLVSAHAALAESLVANQPPGIYNCGYGTGFSVKEVLATFERVSGREIEVAKGERRAGDTAAAVADSSRIRRELGWTPQRQDLDLIVRDAMTWRTRLEEDHARLFA